MKVLVVLLAFVGFGSCVNTCYHTVVDACTQDRNADLPNCNAKYGAFNASIETLLQKYANTHIAHSFDYLLMSTHFGNYQKNRQGFEQLFRKLSDSTWDDAIDLMKYIAKRGGVMDFSAVPASSNPTPETLTANTAGAYEDHELGSLARALDAQKLIAREAHLIHKEVSRNREHDPEVASFLENEFVHKHADSIRALSGHSNDLKRMIKDNSQATLALFLFDEYLQKL